MHRSESGAWDSGQAAIGNASKASREGRFIHRCSLKGFAHESQIIHELLSIFNANYRGA